jgi:hypothetical protein
MNWVPGFLPKEQASWAKSHSERWNARHQNPNEDQNSWSKDAEDWWILDTRRKARHILGLIYDYDP